MEEGKREMDLLLQHFGHEHPLKFVQGHIPPSEEQEKEEEEALCDCCEKRVEGPSYCCSELCKFYLHKRCAELELAPQIHHPIHPQHPLYLLVKSPYEDEYTCDFCRVAFSKFVYHCAFCSFDLDIKCALPHTFCSENQIEEEEEEENQIDGNKKKKPLFGPIYECGKLPLQINHPYDRLHPLSLLPYPTAHQENCSCYLCTIKWKGFVYCCSLCKVELTSEYVTAPQNITAASHEHPWTLLSIPVSFICDFCGVDGDRTPYICTTCNLIVHKNCISMPRNMRISRHPHLISHVYSVQQNLFEELECKICHEKVNARYGNYFCSAFDCNYIAHVNCATDKYVWDGIVGFDDEDENEMSKGVADSRNMITDVISKETVGEDVMATEIKHAYHPHNLILTFKDEMKDDKICDGCMGPISTPFYECQQCRFFLHKSCAELPREKGHAIHKHLLKLKSSDENFFFLLVLGTTVGLATNVTEKNVLATRLTFNAAYSLTP